MTTVETTSYRVEDATSPLWLGGWASAWGDVVRGLRPDRARRAAAMIDAAGLAWTVEQHPIEAVLEDNDGGPRRVPVPMGERAKMPRSRSSEPETGRTEQ